MGYLVKEYNYKHSKEGTFTGNHPANNRKVAMKIAKQIEASGNYAMVMSPEKAWIPGFKKRELVYDTKIGYRTQKTNKINSSKPPRISGRAPRITPPTPRITQKTPRIYR